MWFSISVLKRLERKLQNPHCLQNKIQVTKHRNPSLLWSGSKSSSNFILPCWDPLFNTLNATTLSNPDQLLSKSVMLTHTCFGNCAVLFFWFWKFYSSFKVKLRSCLLQPSTQVSFPGIRGQTQPLQSKTHFTLPGTAHPGQQQEEHQKDLNFSSTISSI